MAFYASPQDFTLNAGASVQVAASGAYLKLLTATGKVRVITNTGITMDLMPGQGFRRQKFDSFIVQDKSGALNTGVFLIASDEMVDDRVTGEVSVIDGMKSRVLANQAFARSQTWNPGAGAYGTAELWNPASSGKLIVLEEISLMQTSALGTGFTMGFATSAQYAAPATGLSKKSGGAASVGQVAKFDEAAAGANLTGIYAFYTDVNRTVPFGLKEPVVILPGAAFRVGALFAGAALSVGFQWFEESL